MSGHNHLFLTKRNETIKIVYATISVFIKNRCITLNNLLLHFQIVILFRIRKNIHEITMFSKLAHKSSALGSSRASFI